MSYKRTVAMTLDPEVVDEAKRQCKVYGLTFSGVVSELLKTWISIGEDDAGTEVRGVQAQGRDPGDGSEGRDGDPAL